MSPLGTESVGGPTTRRSYYTTVVRRFGLGASRDEAGPPRGRGGRRAADSLGEPGALDQVEGVYIISVAARLLEMHPQTLRKYERVGLVRPSRTVGMLRLYSEEDIARLRLIKHLVGDLGLNLAGVQLTLQVFNHLLEVRNRLDDDLSSSQRRAFVERSLDELLELLHAHGPRG